MFKPMALNGCPFAASYFKVILGGLPISKLKSAVISDTEYIDVAKKALYSCSK